MDEIQDVSRCISQDIHLSYDIYLHPNFSDLLLIFSLDDEKHQKNKCSKYASFLETVTITDGRHIFIKVNCRSKKEKKRSSLWCGGDVWVVVLGEQRVHSDTCSLSYHHDALWKFLTKQNLGSYWAMSILLPCRDDNKKAPFSAYFCFWFLTLRQYSL